MRTSRLPSARSVASYLALLKKYNGSVPAAIRKTHTARVRIAGIFAFTHKPGEKPRPQDLPPPGVR